jgi:hypothetical protein
MPPTKSSAASPLPLTTTMTVRCGLCGEHARRTEARTVRAWGRMDCTGGHWYFATTRAVGQLETQWQAGGPEPAALRERLAQAATQGLVTWISAEQGPDFNVVATSRAAIPPELALPQP